MRSRKKIENTKKRQFNFIKLALFSLFFFHVSISIFAQDSIPEKADLTEEAELKFQQFFFKALSEKSIGNYQKSVENLESCNQILTEDTAVFFEFSKNYLLLNNTLLAKEYVQRALANDNQNIWMLKHLVNIHQKEKDYTAAINVQQKIATINPKEREFLIRLFLYNRQYKEAISLMDDLEKENSLSASLKIIKANLVRRENAFKQEEKPSDLNALINQFKTEKSYKILKQILDKSSDNITNLLKFSDEGIALFPAQPAVYFVKGRALNNNKEYKIALSTLKNGIDFVIDDEMEVNFYKEIAKAYKGLGNVKEEKKYIQKAKNLKS